MKNRILYISIFSSLLFGTACVEDILDESPSNSVTIEQSITDEASLNNAVLGIYSSMSAAPAFGNQIITSQELLTDNAMITTNNNGANQPWYVGSYAIAENGDVAGIWNRLYNVVARANNVISKDGQIADLPQVPGTPEQKFAEAYTSRAISLFYLVNYYARPYGTTQQDLGIPIPLSFAPGAMISRSSVPEVYAQIESDLLRAIDLLDGTNTSRQRFGTEAVYILLSRVKLYQREYAQAVQYADLALNSNFGQLLPASEVLAYTTSENQSETLFEIDFTPTVNLGRNGSLNGYWGLTPGSYSQNYLTLEAYDLIPDTDVRKELYTVLTNHPDSPSPVHMTRYRTPDQNIPYVRKTEAILNKIEALYYTNEAEARQQLVNWVADFRNPQFQTQASGTDLLEEILTQRRIEFYLEGHRFFDLNRNQKVIQKGGNCTINCTVEFSHHSRVLPIPLGETRANLNIVQNPGY